MFDWIQLVAAIGVGGAVLFALLWRRAELGMQAREAENAGLKAATDALEASVEKERKSRSRQAEELAELRKRADKAKRRTGKNAPQPMGTATRIQDLEEACEKTTRERDQLRAERDGLVEDLAKLRARIEAGERAAETKASAAPVESPKPTATASLEATLAEARERIRSLESEAQLARQTEVRLRKRMDNQEQLYASLRSELEVKKDRLRTQEEQLQRLQALKVAVIDQA